MTKDPEGEALILAMREAIMAVAAHSFPELYEDTVEDDGETYQALRCPVCDGLVSDGNLAAVSVDEHWQHADDPDDDAFDHGRITFDSSDDRDLGDTVFYLHNDNHAVDLPDGWKEDWS